jgi:methylmalonyl-CoA/ethylmalonyl-CoA epimerase
VGKFLAKRGPGLHHVAYQVTDVEAELGRLRGPPARVYVRTERQEHRVGFGA